jgi:hypothetical protein
MLLKTLPKLLSALLFLFSVSGYMPGADQPCNRKPPILIFMLGSGRRKKEEASAQNGKENLPEKK